MPASERPSTWGKTLAGAIIFVQFPLTYYLGTYFYRADTGLAEPGSLREIAQALLFFGTWFIIPGVGLAVGWLKGFPRWAYPYAAVSLVNAMYLMNAATPGVAVFGVYFFDRQLWGLRACVPALLVLAIVLLLTRSLRSLIPFFENGWNDWTHFTYALFGFMPLINFIAFDEVIDSFEMPYQFALAIIMALTAVAYMRSTSPARRILSLLAGFGLTVAIDSIAPTIYWLENGGADLSQILFISACFLMIVFTPALIGAHLYLSKRIRENP